MEDLSSLYTVNDDSTVTFQEGLGGSWLALAKEHYIATMQGQKTEE